MSSNIRERYVDESGAVSRRSGSSPRQRPRPTHNAWISSRSGHVLLGGGTIIVALVLWEAAVRVFQVPQYVIPAPTSAFLKLFEQWQLILASTWVTSIEILLGFVAGALGGAALGIAIHRFKVVEVALNPLIVFFQIIPKIALAPIFLLWFGFGLAPKILLVAMIAFFPVTLNTIAGLAATNPDLGYLVRSVGGSRNQYLRRVELPSAMPQVFAGLKIAMTFSVIGAIVAEFTGGSEGLGYLILFASSQVQTPLLFAGLFAISILGLIMYYLIVYMEYLLLPWQRKAVGVDGPSINWKQ